MVWQDLDAALQAGSAVVKRQRTCASTVGDCVDRLLSLAQTAREAAAGGSLDALAQLQAQAEAAGCVKDANAATRELHSAISRLSKALDKAFDTQTDICKGLREVSFDAATLAKVVAEHLYREGRFELADAYVAEAGLPDAAKLREPYVQLHTVLQQIKQHNLGPALAWAQQHRGVLSLDGSPGAFEFRLHELTFLNCLAAGGQAAALAYAKQHFGPFRAKHMREIQRLMGCLLFVGRDPEDTPYADLLSPTRWSEVGTEFARQACSLMGQAYDSPLAVAVAAGSVALPPLLKLAGVMERGGQDLASCEQLPIEIELGQEFVYHSIFACPVSRDQSTPDNPPKLLPCSHVLCEQSILKIARSSRTRVFKCPYCPMEARADNTRTLIFPDVE